jgi:8-oxo-dGTP pyrophosphatase MutT (NUDIX family)
MAQYHNLVLSILLLLQSTLIPSTLVHSFAFTNPASFQITQLKNGPIGSSKSKISKIMMMMTKVENEVSNIKTSLAALYVIYNQNFTDGTKYEPTIWTLVPLDKFRHQEKGENSYSDGVGSIAIKALQSSLNQQKQEIDTESIRLICKIVEQNDGDNTMDVTAEIPSLDNEQFATKEEKDYLHLLLATLSRIMVQKKVRESKISSSTITIDLPSINGAKVTEIFQLEDISSSDFCTCNPSIYKSMLPSNIDLKSIEMSDMVDSSGDVIGSLPRILVHKLNILHRGVGIVVCDNEHITKSLSAPIIDNIPIYCHRRTETKRIFPNLYDMFVGGVSISGEDAILTASREVAEELGLGKALKCIESSSKDTSPLSDPLFKCTICTSYNRCVVTVFTYKYLSSEESIRWQEEEVSWGDFVPYQTVEKAAMLSIKRLIENGKWPGSGDDYEVTQIKSSSQADNWDFVPDGLLVWVAWLQWLQKGMVDDDFILELTDS